MKVTINGKVPADAITLILDEQKEKTKVIDEYCKKNKIDSFFYKDAELEYEFYNKPAEILEKLETPTILNKKKGVETR